MREPVRELAVVREQKRAGRVGVESPDGDDACLVADEVDDRAPPVRIVRRRHDAGRLVEEHVGEGLRRERLAVELDGVVRLDERVELARLAVDEDAARLDQLVGLAPGGNSGPREVGVQAHTGILTFGTVPAPTRADFLSTIALGRRLGVPR